MPRLFVIRHGETEWSLNGRHTGRSDIPLTARGEEQIKANAPNLIGPGKIDPQNLAMVLVSPRQRAHKTFHLLFKDSGDVPHELTEEVREWDYGEYEGLLSSEIKQLKPTWAIWNDGCPGKDGESVDQMTKRVDGVINKVQEYHKRYVDGVEGARRDVLIVAHGHLSRVLISRWIQFPLALGTHFNVEPAGVAILSYNHNNLDEPALNALNLHASLR